MTTPNRPPLSPAAQAVLDAYINAPCGKSRRTWVAAALRAAADQGEALFDEYDNVAYAVRVDCLLAIAAELDGATTTSENVLGGGSDG